MHILLYFFMSTTAPTAFKRTEWLIVEQGYQWMIYFQFGIVIDTGLLQLESQSYCFIIGL